MIRYPIPVFSGWFPYDLFLFKWKIIVIVIYIEIFFFIHFINKGRLKKATRSSYEKLTVFPTHQTNDMCFGIRFVDYPLEFISSLRSTQLIPDKCIGVNFHFKFLNCDMLAIIIGKGRAHYIRNSESKCSLEIITKKIYLMCLAVNIVFFIRTNEHSHIALNSSVESCFVHCYSLYSFLLFVYLDLCGFSSASISIFNLSHHLLADKDPLTQRLERQCWAHKLNGNSNDPLPAAFQLYAFWYDAVYQLHFTHSITRRRTNALITIIL